jgi:hypothetical protein
VKHPVYAENMFCHRTSLLPDPPDGTHEIGIRREIKINLLFLIHVYQLQKYY